MLNLYKFHTDPASLIQQGSHANMEEVYDHAYPQFELYVHYFNDDSDSDERVTITTTKDDDMSQTVLSFKRGDETYKRITFIIMVRHDDIVIAGRSASIDSPKPFTSNLRVYEHGIFNAEAVDDFIEELLHHF